jgi:hypothetical protein
MLRHATRPCRKSTPTAPELEKKTADLTALRESLA